jgi:hypothetical protein
MLTVSRQGNLKALALGIFLALCSLFYFANKTISVYQLGYYDLPIFTQAAVRYWKDEPIYQRSDNLADSYKPGAIIYKFPPPYLLNFIPWLDASGQQSPHFRLGATLIYVIIYAATVFMVCYLLLRPRTSCVGSLIRHEGRVFGLLATSFACVFMPFFVVQGGTSAEGYIIALALLAFICMRSFPWLAGLIFIWLASIKLYPVFLLLYPLLTRQWKVLASAALCTGGIAWLSLHVFGATENIFYVNNILPVLLSEPVSEDWTTMFLHTTGNQGILKVLVSYGLLPNRLPFWLNAIRLPFVFGMFFIFWKYCRQHDDENWRSLLGFSLAIITMLICLPNVFYSYFILLLPPILVLAGFLWSQKHWWKLFFLACCAGSFMVDDKYIYAMAHQAHLFEPTQDMLQEVQTVGISDYLWRHHTILMVLWCYGVAAPFMPYVLWLTLAVSLQRLRFSPVRKVS